MTKKIKLSQRIITILLLVIVMIVSIGISYFASNPETYKATIDILDEKKADALALSASATGVAVAITALTKDIAEPIAEILTNIASHTVLITSVIFLEKFLLTTIGTATFMFLIPCACLLAILFQFLKKEFLKSLAIKLAVFGILLAMIIPISTRLGVYIEETHKISYEEINNIATEITDEDKSFLEKFKDQTDKIKNFVEDKMNYFIDSIAVMLITTCAIPIGVLAFLLWLIKIIFGVNINMPKPQKAANKFRRKLMDREDDSTELTIS